MTHSDLNSKWNHVKSNMLQYIADGDVIVTDPNASPELKRQRLDTLTEKFAVG